MSMSRGTAKAGLTRRALVLAAPSLLLPRAVLAALAGLAVLSWFLFTARIVHIRIDPVADRIVLRAGLSGCGIGGRFLIRPGTYRLTGT